MNTTRKHNSTILARRMTPDETVVYKAAEPYFVNSRVAHQLVGRIEYVIHCADRMQAMFGLGALVETILFNMLAYRKDSFMTGLK